MDIKFPSQLLNYSQWPQGSVLVALGAEPEHPRRPDTGELDWHHHAHGQLFCVERGLIHVQTPQGAWLLPPQRAGWIPPGVPHKVRFSGVLQDWNLLLAPDFCRGLPEHPCVIGLTDLLRALARRACSWHKPGPWTAEMARISAVIHDEIGHAVHHDLHVPMPHDPRLLRVANAIVDQPGSDRSLEQWAEFGAMSPRTLRRLIRKETGMSFAQWRQQAQLAFGLDHLARGEAVATVADALGYASPSNFIAMFRKALGDSPAHYFAARDR